MTAFTGFITRVCASFVEGPTCCACGSRKAQTGWMLDALGSVQGFCGHCARQGGAHERLFMESFPDDHPTHTAVEASGQL